MPDDTELFAGSSPACRAMALRLWPLLTRDGAEFYAVNINGQARVGWALKSKHRVLATLKCMRNGLRLGLRVGTDSRFMATGLLEQDHTRADGGTVLLQGDDIPDWLHGAIDDAFRLAAERRAAQHTRPRWRGAR